MFQKHVSITMFSSFLSEMLIIVAIEILASVLSVQPQQLNVQFVVIMFLIPFELNIQ